MSPSTCLLTLPPALCFQASKLGVSPGSSSRPRAETPPAELPLQWVFQGGQGLESSLANQALISPRDQISGGDLAGQVYDMNPSCFQGDPGPEGPAGPPGPPGKPVSVLRLPEWQCTAEEEESLAKAGGGEGSHEALFPHIS